MVAIYVRNRAFRDAHEPFDCSFVVVDGDNYPDCPEMRPGDRVSLFFRIPRDQFDAIEALNIREIRKDMMASYGPPDSRGECSVSIPFDIVRRNHSFSWRETGRVQRLDGSVTLEAISQYWEDIFLWVCMDTLPAWAEAGAS